ncbi:serine/threonine-protein phosphatase 7 long form-like protein [Senna tora]|uniref:Serine/threonine-protein phosphatase 7 long form-like protein n=1 Tax=Senna tora TaxID=362788 RepID=A0A834WE46_9FABA|nr:serine/threonine-protein phosphatase 7 long form-like protein [Senna tora]
MDFQPKPEPHSPPPLPSAAADDTANYMHMSFSDLISRLRDAESLKTRLNRKVGKKKTKINSLKERLMFEMLEKMKVEEQLKEQGKKGKEAAERYEGLLEVLRTQNRELKKLLEDALKPEEEQGDAIAKLRGLICKRKFVGLNDGVSDLGNGAELLKKEDGTTSEIHVHEREVVTISAAIGDSSSTNTNEVTIASPGMAILEASMIGRRLLVCMLECYGGRLVTPRIFKTRRCDDTPTFYPPSELLPYLRQAGFYGAALSGFFPADKALISALVERWRPETHTFHMPMGEVTITLQDVAVQMGLPVDGEAVVGQTNLNCPDICERLLGCRPPEAVFKFRKLSLRWLHQNFSQIPMNATIQQLQQYTRAYILMLIGGVLMCDKTSAVSLMYLPLLEDLEKAGRYSWGSAVLAHLYRELCVATDWTRSDFGGCVQLIHMWAWDRFPCIAPTIRGRNKGRLSEEEERQALPLPPPLGLRWSNYLGSKENPQRLLVYYRDILDNLKDNDIVWQPYRSPDCQTEIPDYCLVGSHVWQAHVPLVCFHIIEWHQPDRVLRQFGMDQPIPNMPVDMDWEHTQTLQGKIETNWAVEHQPYIELWNQRHSRTTAFGKIYEMASCRPPMLKDILQFCLDMMRELEIVEQQSQGREIHRAPLTQPMIVISGRVGKQRSRAAELLSLRSDMDGDMYGKIMHLEGSGVAAAQDDSVGLAPVDTWSEKKQKNSND